MPPIPISMTTTNVRRGGRFWGALPLLALLVFGVGASFAQSPAEPLRLTQLNRTYENLVDQLEPIEVGGALVRLRSPKHVLSLVDNRTTFLPGGAPGEWRISVAVSFRGEGEIEADVSMGRIRQTLRDYLIARDQTVQIEALVSVARGETGYLIRTLELPARVVVDIESRLIGNLVALCRPMALVLVGTDCVALERRLSRLEVPLPHAGESYILPYEDLTSDERTRFDRFLDQG